MFSRFTVRCATSKSSDAMLPDKIEGHDDVHAAGGDLVSALVNRGWASAMMNRPAPASAATAETPRSASGVTLRTARTSWTEE